MPCKPNPPSQRGVELKMWKQLKPLTWDKLGLFILKGSLTSKKRNVKIRVTLQMIGFYRLSFSKHTLPAGRTTSRHATPLGDGRGVPKHFRDFGKFSKCSTAFSQPTLPEGLGRVRPQSVFQSRNPDGTVTVFVTQVLSSRVTLIYADITKMDLNDLSLSESLGDLIYSVDFGVPSDKGDSSFPRMTDEELKANLPPRLPSPNDALSSTTSISPTTQSRSSQTFPKTQPSSSRTASTSVIQYAPPQQILSSAICPTRVLPNAQHRQSATSPACSTSLLPTAQSPQPQPRLSSSGHSYKVHQKGSTTFEVTEANGNPSDISPKSQPSTSSASSSVPFPSSSTVLSTPQPLPESKEEKKRRQNIDGCKKYQEKMKKKAAELPKELERLEKRNRELKAIVKGMEEMVAWGKRRKKK